MSCGISIITPISQDKYYYNLMLILTIYRNERDDIQNDQELIE